MDMEDVVARLRAVVIETAEALPARDVTNVWELLDAGEPGVALENLCTQLYEYEVVVAPSVVESVRELCVAMGLRDHYWRLLADDAAPS